MEQSPNDFETSIEQDIDGQECLMIKYKDTPFYFLVREDLDAFDRFDCRFTLYAPQYPLSSFFPNNSYEDFNYILSVFKDWINSEFKEYLASFDDEEDLWAQYKSGKKSLTFNEITFDDHTSFSNDEKKQITMAINELKFLVSKNHITTTNEEQSIVEKRLDYMIESLDKLNKFEWQSTLISTLISISITLTLDTQKGHLLFELLKKVFSSLPKLIQ